MLRRILLATIAAISAVFMTASAASAQYGDEGGAAGGQEAPAQEQAAGGITAPQATTEIKAWESPELGTVIVDAKGWVLYGFTPDKGGQPTCNGDCAAKWPALIAEGGQLPAVGEGLDESKLSTAKRADGATQVLYNNWPLYYYASDAKAGDTAGQGVGDKWYVLNTAGALVKEAAAGAGEAGELPFTGPGQTTRLLLIGFTITAAGGLLLLGARRYGVATGRHIAKHMAGGRRTRH